MGCRIQGDKLLNSEERLFRDLPAICSTLNL